VPEERVVGCSARMRESGRGRVPMRLPIGPALATTVYNVAGARARAVVSRR